MHSLAYMSYGTLEYKQHKCKRRETRHFKHEPETIQWTPLVSMFGSDLSAIVILLESITNLYPCLSSLSFAAIEGLISKTLGYFVGWLL